MTETLRVSHSVCVAGEFRTFDLKFQRDSFTINCCHLLNNALLEQNVRDH